LTLRSVLAVLAGGIVAVVLFQLGAIIAFVTLYGIPLGASPGPPSAGYFAANLGFAAIAAVVGGWVTARFAQPRPLVATGFLAVILAVIAVSAFSKPGSQWSAWFPPVLALIALAGTLAGGLLRVGR
jgi:hypothetical protein